MLLDRTYFTGNLSLPQLSTSTGPSVGAARATQTVGEYSLDWYIARYEPEFLRNLLGCKLADAFIKGIKESPPAQIWVDLRDKIYITDGNFKFSPAANYVYFFAMRNSNSQTGMTGEQKHRPSFADNMSPAPKQVDAWNNMSDPILSIYRFIKDNWSSYEPYSDGVPHCGWFGPINILGI